MPLDSTHYPGLRSGRVARALVWAALLAFGAALAALGIAIVNLAGGWV